MAQKPIRILVLLRETCDPHPPVRMTADGYSVDERGLRRISNPADLAALEQALRLAEKISAEVSVLAIGPQRLDDHLRLALSMGAKSALRVWSGHFQGGDAHAEARVLERICTILAPDLLFSGSTLLDRDDDPVPALAAAQRGQSCLPAALNVQLEKGQVLVLGKGDRGARQKRIAPLPCTILFADESADPRYPDQQALLDALDADIEVWGLAELGISVRELGAAGALLTRGRCAQPRPNPQRTVTPDADLPAFERILALLSGGLKQRAGKIYTLSAEQTADKLLQIFTAEGLLGGETP